MNIYCSVTCLIVPCQSPKSASSGLQMPDFIFDINNKIPTLKYLYLHTIKHIRVWPLHQNLTGLQPESASNGLQVPDIILDIRNKLLTLKKIYLDIIKDILHYDLPFRTWPASGSASGGLQEPPGKFNLVPSWPQ